MAKRERVELVSGVRITTEDNYLVLDDGSDPLTEAELPGGGCRTLNIFGIFGCRYVRHGRPYKQLL